MLEIRNEYKILVRKSGVKSPQGGRC